MKFPVVLPAFAGAFFLLIVPVRAASNSCAEQFALLWKQSLTGREVGNAHAEYKRTIALVSKLDQALPKNPEIEMGLKRTFVGGPGGNGWEAGVSQEFDIAGQASVRRRIADLRRREARLKAILAVMDTRARFRTALVRFQSADALLDHLSEHTQQLRTWEARGFPRDVRMGPYTAKAGRAALAILETNMNRAQADLTASRIELSRIVGTPVTIEHCSVMEFPDLPPTDSMDLSHGATIELANNRVLLAQEERTLAGRNAVPPVSIFVFGGTQTVPTGFPSSSADRERYVRFGLRIPLPVFDTGTPAKLSADAALEGARVEKDGASSRWMEAVRLEVERYVVQKKDLLRLSKVREEGHGYSGLLEAAYLSGRITFYEFWGEHDRWHELENQYADAAIRLSESLGRIEASTGMTIENVPLPDWLKTAHPEGDGAAR